MKAAAPVLPVLPVLLVLLVLLGSVPAAWCGEPVGGGRLDRIADAFRHLVDEALWTVERTHAEGAELERLVRAETGAASPPGLLARAAVRARLRAAGPEMDVSVLAFDSAVNAAQHARARTQARRREAVRPEIRHEFAAFDVLPGGRGYYARRATTAGAATRTRDRHLVQVDRFVMRIAIDDAPFVTRAAQQAALARAGALARDPASVRDRPVPPTPPLGPAWRVLTVRVVDPQDRVVPRAQVAALVRAGKPGERTVYGRCVGGRCRLPLGREDEGTVHAWQPRGEDGAPLAYVAPAPVPFTASAREAVVRLASGAAIRGRVLETDGTPAAGVRVRAKLDGSDRIEPARSVHGAETTDARGAFRLPSLVPRARYELELERHGRRAGARRIWIRAGSPPAVLRLHPVVHARLRVLDHRGEPVPLAIVKASRGFGHRVQAATDFQGRVVLEGLDPAWTYDLSVDVLVSPAPVVPLYRPAWTPKDETLRLEHGWRLRGCVQAYDGDPPDGDTVLYVRARGVLLRGVLAYHLVDDDGCFDVRGVPYGAVEVAAVPRDADPDDDALAWTRIEPTDEAVTLHLPRPPARTR